MNTRLPSKRFFHWQRAAVAGWSLLGLAIALIIGGLFGYNDIIEIPLIKMRFALRGELTPDPRIAIVAIDDNTLSELQDFDIPYPLPRKLQGELLKRLADGGARIVCFDLLFDMHSLYGAEDDESFRDAINYAQEKGTKVILSAALPQLSSAGYGQVTYLEPVPTLMDAKPYLGLANTAVIEGRGKGAYRDKEKSIFEFHGDKLYSQATQMYRLFLEEEGREFIPDKHGIDANGFMYVNYFNGGQKHITTVQFLQLFPEVFDGVNPLTGETQKDADDWESGETAKMLGLDSGSDSGWDDFEDSGESGYSGDSTAEQEKSEKSDTAITNGDEKPDDISKINGIKKPIDSGNFRDKFVFVGSYSEADNDYFSTPFTDKMFGVETNASAFQTYLSELHIKTAPLWLTILILLAVSILAGHIAIYLESTKSPWMGILTLILIALLLAGVFVWWRLLLNATYTLLSYALAFGVTLSVKLYSEEKEKAKIRRTFSRYMSEAVVNEIIGNPDLANLGGEDRQVVVLFSDIRNFSTISENMPPRDIVNFLNTYFESTSTIIDQHKGYIDKFMGDGIMAVFGAPVPLENPALEGVKCGLSMLKNLKEVVHPQMKELGVPEFKIGVGVHFGHVIMGNIGSKRRTDYSIIGDAVNLAARLEATTKEYKKALIVSEEVYKIIKNDLPCHFLDTVKVKGRARDEKIYWIEHPDIPGLTDL